MTPSPQWADRFERLAWIILVATVAITPLAVGNLAGMQQPLAFNHFGLPQNVTLSVGAALSLLCWGIASLLGKTAVRISRTLMAFAFFGIWAGVCTITGLDPLRSVFGSSTSPMSLMLIGAYLAVLFLASQFAGSRARMRVVTWAVIGSASVVTLFALVQQFTGSGIFTVLPAAGPWLAQRGFSTMGNPDQLGTYLVLPVILSGFLAVFEDSPRLRTTATVCMTAMVIAMTRTLTRGAWIAVIVGVVIAVSLLWRRPSVAKKGTSLLIVGGLCLAAVAIALVSSNSTYLAHRFGGLSDVTKPGVSSEAINTVSSDRVRLWQSSLAIVAQRPLTGTGPAAFELGWYGTAIKPSSAGGEGGLADDPHSLPVHVLATTGIPGLLAYLVAIGSVLVIGGRTAFSLSRSKDLSGKSAYYVAWFVAAGALQVALLVAAINSPILLYLFLSSALLLLPTVRASEAGNPVLTRYIPAAVAFVLTGALLLAPSVVTAEGALASASSGGSIDAARKAAEALPWNREIQRAYFHLRVTDVNALIAAGSDTARAAVDELDAELQAMQAREPRELYFPSVRAQLLVQAGNKLGVQAYSEAAVRAADQALAIMPTHIPTRVNRALALADLKRYPEMAASLRGYWENELSSSYPGILYAQALALSGDKAGSDAVFAELTTRFPDDPSIEQARQQVDSAAPKK